MNRLPLFLFVLPFIAFSQANILNAKSPDEIGITSAYDEVDSDQEPLYNKDLSAIKMYCFLRPFGKK